MGGIPTIKHGWFIIAIPTLLESPQSSNGPHDTWFPTCDFIPLYTHLFFTGSKTDSHELPWSPKFVKKKTSMSHLVPSHFPCPWDPQASFEAPWQLRGIRKQRHVVVPGALRHALRRPGAAVPGGAAGELPPGRPRAPAAGAADASRLWAGEVLPETRRKGLGDWNGHEQSGDSGDFCFQDLMFLFFFCFYISSFLKLGLE